MPTKVRDHFDARAGTILLHGDVDDRFGQIPDKSVRLVVTSPPYNLGKEYEKQVLSFTDYLEDFRPVLAELSRVLPSGGSVCWQVGNYVKDGEVVPLDIEFYPMFRDFGFVLRNRIIWHFDHGLHAKKRLSGRYETILWFTKGSGSPYVFNLDPIRVPSKYPGKTSYKPGPNYGKPSGNPAGKNPSDFWKIIKADWTRGVWEIPNVKSNHPEKTGHPCQFPIELVERCVLALSNKGDLVLDPYAGSGTTLVAARLHGRRAIGIEKEGHYVKNARRRLALLEAGELPRRPLGKPVYQPSGNERAARIPPEWSRGD